MTTRAEMLESAFGLVRDSARQLRVISVVEPDRIATAQMVLADASRVYNLLRSGATLRTIGAEVKARLQRANLLTQALTERVQ